MVLPQTNFGDDSSLGLCNVLSFNGPSEKVFNEMDSISYGLDLQCVNDVCDMLEVSMFDVDGNLGMASGFNGFKPSGRRRKKSKKRVAQLVYGDKDPNDVISDDSILDDGIEHKNSIIRNETVATWDVSQSLGISFDCDKEKLIEVFMESEHEEMKGKMSRT